MLPGRWVENHSPPGGWDAAPPPPQPPGHVLDNNNSQVNVTFVARKYRPSEKLRPEHWDHRRLAEHVSAVMSIDRAPAAVSFILGNHISGSFLLNYTHDVDEMTISKSECDLIRRIAKVVPFALEIPRRKVRFAGDSYSLPELVQVLSSRFTNDHSLVADETEEDVFEWEENSPPSAGPDSKWVPVERAEDLLSLVEPQKIETECPLKLIPQTTLSQDIFTSPALSNMGFLNDFPTVPRPSQPTTPQVSEAHVTRLSTPVRRADNLLTAVVQGCPFLCFGAVLARLTPTSLRIPRTLSFPWRLIAKTEENCAPVER